jgi:hypothetical protein
MQALATLRDIGCDSLAGRLLVASYSAWPSAGHSTAADVANGPSICTHRKPLTGLPASSDNSSRYVAPQLGQDIIESSGSGCSWGQRLFGSTGGWRVGPNALEYLGEEVGTRADSRACPATWQWQEVDETVRPVEAIEVRPLLRGENRGARHRARHRLADQTARDCEDARRFQPAPRRRPQRPR